MPRLPSPEDFGTELPRGDRGFVPISPDQSGKGLQDFAHRIERMAEEEAGKLDRLNTQDALTELSNAETDLAFGENGYLSRKELATKDPNFSKPFREKYDQHVNTIAAKLNSPRAREAFLSEAAQKRMQFNRGLVTHVAREFDKAQDRTVEIKMASITQRLGFDPTQLSGQLVEFNSVAQLYRPMFGTGEEGNKSFTEWYNQKVGGIAAQAARSAINQKNFDFAENVLKDHGRLMGKEADDIRTTLDTQQAYTTGGGLALEASNLPLEKQASFLLSKAGDKPKVHEVAKARLEALNKEKEYGYYETVGRLKTSSGFNTSPTRAKMMEITASQEFLSIPASIRTEQEERMREQVNTQQSQSRAAANAAKVDKPLDIGAYGKFFDLVSDPGIAAKPEGWAESHEKELGSELTLKLMAARSEARSNANRFTIPKAELDAAARLVGLTKLDDVRAWKGKVYEFEGNWKSHPRNKGKVPDEDTVNQWYAAAAKEYVAKTSWFGMSKDKVQGFKLRPIPPEFVRAAQAERSKLKKAPLSLEGLLEAWAMQKGSRYEE